MDTIVVIKEECHGLIGIAKGLVSAADFLIHEHWVKRFTEVWDGYDENGSAIYSTVEDEANKRNMTWENYIINTCLNEDWRTLERMGICFSYWTLYDKDKI